MTDTDLPKIKARIRALSERTIDRGCTEAEAIAAAELMGRLLEQYSLTMDEVDVREEVCRTTRMDSGSKVRDEAWSYVFELARFGNCKAWFNTPRRGQNGSYSFFGADSDVQAVEWLFKVVQAAIEREAAHYKTTADYRLSDCRRTASKSFRVGMARRIAQRLAKMRVERELAVAKAERERREAAREQAEIVWRNANPGRVREAAMVRAKQARGEELSVEDFRTLCRYDADLAEARGDTARGSSLVVLKQQIVDAEYGKLGLKLRSDRFTPRAADGAAYRSGAAAGDRVSLARGVQGGSDARRLS